VLGVRPPRERRDAAEHRQQVLRAAERLFGERGYEAVTMDEIAHAAGVGKGTLYRRYGDKSQLVMALMDRCVANLQDDLSRIAAYAQTLEELKAVIGRMAAWTEEHASELGIIAEQRSMHGSPLYEWMHGLLLDLLVDALERGEARIADPVYAADALLAAIDVDLYLFQRRSRGYSAKQIEAGLHSLIDGFRVNARI
jgi:AcrR family transcriptional regulator